MILNEHQFINVFLTMCHNSVHLRRVGILAREAREALGVVHHIARVHIHDCSSAAGFNEYSTPGFSCRSAPDGSWARLRMK